MIAQIARLLGYRMYTVTLEVTADPKSIQYNILAKNLYEAEEYGKKRLVKSNMSSLIVNRKAPTHECDID